MQMAFSMVSGLPWLSVVMPSKYLIFAGAVAADGEGICHVADVVLTGIEGVLLGPDRGGVTVGDDHFRQRGPVDDGPFGVFVTEAELVKDQAFAGGEADTEGPVGPPDVVSGDLEGSTFGLGDGNGLQVGAGRPDVFGQVVAGGFGDRDGFVVLDPGDCAGAEVIDHDEVLDRVGLPRPTKCRKPTRNSGGDPTDAAGRGGFRELNQPAAAFEGALYE